MKLSMSMRDSTKAQLAALVRLELVMKFISSSQSVVSPLSTPSVTAELVMWP